MSLNTVRTVPSVTRPVLDRSISGILRVPCAYGRRHTINVALWHTCDRTLLHKVAVSPFVSNIAQYIDGHCRCSLGNRLKTCSVGYRSASGQQLYLERPI